MSKSNEKIISDFNINTNMSVGELESWLKNPKSQEAGTGVGVESGHKIVDILKKNPDKDPEKYDENDIKHMRKVVNYDKRHMAQEDHLKDTKTEEELENTKSTKSLRNWGHDPIKTLDGREGSQSEGETEEVAASEPGDAESATDDKAAPKPSAKRKHDDTQSDQDADNDKAADVDDVDDLDDDSNKPSATKKSKTDEEDEEDGEGDDVRDEDEEV